MEKRLEKYVKFLVFCKLGSYGIFILPDDIEFIGDNGVAACLVRATGEEYLWFEDGACYYRYDRAADYYIRYEGFDIQIILWTREIV